MTGFGLEVKRAISSSALLSKEQRAEFPAATDRDAREMQQVAHPSATDRHWE
jgi:hypothetical protein